jgi:hypothetical protein
MFFDATFRPSMRYQETHGLFYFVSSRDPTIARIKFSLCWNIFEANKISETRKFSAWERWMRSPNEQKTACPIIWENPTVFTYNNCVIRGTFFIDINWNNFSGLPVRNWLISVNFSLHKCFFKKTGQSGMESGSDMVQVRWQLRFS